MMRGATTGGGRTQARGEYLPPTHRPHRSALQARGAKRRPIGRASGAGDAFVLTSTTRASGHRTNTTETVAVAALGGAVAPLFLGAHVRRVKDRLFARYLRRSESPDAAVRARAIRVLGWFDRPAARERVYAGLKDPALAVRWAALQNAFSRYDLHALPTLLAIDTDDSATEMALRLAISHLRARMTEGTTTLSDRQVHSALASPHSVVRQAGVAGANDGFTTPEFLERLLTQDTDPGVRWQAIRRAARLHWSKTGSLALQALRDSYLTVRLEAIRLAGQLLLIPNEQVPNAQGPIGAALLARLEDGTEDPRLRIEAAKALLFVRAVTPRNIHDVCQEILTAGTPLDASVRRDAVELLVTHLSPSDVSLLHTLAGDEYPGVRELAVLALSRFPSAEVIALLITTAETDPARPVRKAAVTALERLVPGLVQQRRKRAAAERTSEERAARRVQANTVFWSVFSGDAITAHDWLEWPSRPHDAAQLNLPYDALARMIQGNPDRLAAMRGLAETDDAGARWFMKRYLAEAEALADQALATPASHHRSS